MVNIGVSKHDSVKIYYIKSGHTTKSSMLKLNHVGPLEKFSFFMGFLKLRENAQSGNCGLGAEVWG